METAITLITEKNRLVILRFATGMTGFTIRTLPVVLLNVPDHVRLDFHAVWMMPLSAISTLEHNVETRTTLLCRVRA